MSLRERQREAAMEVILASAAEVFSQNGYYGSSMEDVARACDCAPATLYGYFKGKQELFARMVRERVENYMLGVGSALGSSEDFEGGFRAYLQHFASWGTSNKDFLRLLISVLRNPDGCHPDPDAARALEEAYLMAISSLMQRGLDEGSLRAARSQVLAASLIGMLHANVWHVLERGEDSELADTVHFVGDLFLQGARSGKEVGS